MNRGARTPEHYWGTERMSELYADPREIAPVKVKFGNCFRTNFKHPLDPPVSRAAANAARNKMTFNAARSSTARRRPPWGECSNPAFNVLSAAPHSVPIFLRAMCRPPPATVRYAHFG